MYDKEFLRGCMKNEGPSLSDLLFDKLIEAGETEFIKAKEYLIAPGQIDRSIYILASGFTKLVYFDEKKESILGFGGIGTISISPLSYYMGKPAFCGFQALTDCEVIKIKKSDFDFLISTYPELSSWIFNIAMFQYCLFELKLKMLSEGDPISNYKKLMNKKMTLHNDGINDPTRIKLISMVPSQDLASYLGITPSYLSNIRPVAVKRGTKFSAC